MHKIITFPYLINFKTLYEYVPTLNIQLPHYKIQNLLEKKITRSILKRAALRKEEKKKNIDLFPDREWAGSPLSLPAAGVYGCPAVLTQNKVEKGNKKLVRCTAFIFPVERQSGTWRTLFSAWFKLFSSVYISYVYQSHIFLCLVAALNI